MMVTWLFVALGSIGDALPLVHVAKEADTTRLQQGVYDERRETQRRRVVVLVSKNIKETLAQLTPLNGLVVVEDKYGPLLSAAERENNVEQEGLQTIVEIITSHAVTGVVANFFSAFALHAAELKNCKFAILSPSFPPRDAIQTSWKRIYKLVHKFSGWASCINGSGCTLDQVSYWMGNVLSKGYLEFRKQKEMPSLPFWWSKFPNIPILLGMSQTLCPYDAEIPEMAQFTGQCTVTTNEHPEYPGSEYAHFILQELKSRCKDELFSLIATLGSMEPFLSIHASRGDPWMKTLVSISSSVARQGVLLHRTSGTIGLYRCFTDGRDLFFESEEKDSNSIDSRLTALSLWILTGPVPQTEVFPLGQVVMHHGGAGSVVVSVLSKRPQIVCSLAYDQEQWGEFVEQSGMGKLLRFDVVHKSQSVLTETLSFLTSNYIYFYENVAAFAHKVSANGSGPRSAVDLLSKGWGEQ